MTLAERLKEIPGSHSETAYAAIVRIEELEVAEKLIEAVNQHAPVLINWSNETREAAGVAVHNLLAAYDKVKEAA